MRREVLFSPDTNDCMIVLLICVLSLYIVILLFQLHEIYHKYLDACFRKSQIQQGQSSAQRPKACS